MSQVCAHCGEVYEAEGRLVCPHCGADTDLTWSEPPTEDEDEEEAYRETLENEGLAGNAGKRGCAGAVLLAVSLPAALLGALL